VDKKSKTKEKELEIEEIYLTQKDRKMLHINQNSEICLPLIISSFSFSTLLLLSQKNQKLLF
jgi:hypothetical protein